MAEISKKNLRIFGLVLGAVCIIFGSRLFFKWHKTGFLYLAAIGIFLIASGAIYPLILKPVYRVWMKIASIINWLITKVLFILVFYVVMTPMGLLLKLCRRDLLDLKFDKDKNSYWIRREQKILNPEQYEKQF